MNTVAMRPLRVEQGETQVVVSGKDVKATFDKKAGTLASLRYKGTELIETPLRPDFWRAPTDNDRGRNMADGPSRRAYGARPTRARRSAASR